MTLKPFFCLVSLPRPRWAVLVLSMISAVLWAGPASAQLSRVGNSIGIMGNPAVGVIRGSDIGYDPAHDVYLVVGGHGPVFGTWVDANGTIVAGTAQFLIGSTNTDTWGAFPRCEYSPDINGGQGGFLVTWHQNDGKPNFVHALVVAYPMGVISANRVLSNANTYFEAGAPIAYSQTSRRFFVAWQTQRFEIQGRFVELDGSPTPGLGVMPLENADCGRDPGLTWNPATNDFGLSYSGFCGNSGAFAAFRRIGPTGALSPRLSFGFAVGTYNTDVDVNTETRHYIVTWARDAGSSEQEIDELGAPVGPPSLISARVGGSTSLSVAYNAASGTLLAVGQDPNSTEVVGVELDGHGKATTGMTILTNGGGRSGSFYPRVTARARTRQWNIAYSRQLTTIANQIVATASSSTGVRLQIDTPGPGALVTNPFTITGFAVDTRATADSGIDLLHIYAIPHWTAPAVFMGALNVGSPRPDVAQTLGESFRNSGWSGSMAHLGPGAYTLVVYPRSTVTGQFEFDRAATVEITVRGGIYTQVDTPGWGSAVADRGVGMIVAGWAVNFDAASGTGIDAMDVWAIDVSTGAGTFLGSAVMGGIRPDVGAAFDAKLAPSGYSLTNQVPLAPGTYYLAAYSHNVGGSFNIARLSLFTISP